MNERQTAMRLLIGLAFSAILVTACDAPERPSDAPSSIEAVSLLGDSLGRPPVDSVVRGRYEALLTVARTAWERARDNVDSIIWLGRRTAYLGRYGEAIEIYTSGLATHPDDPRLLRHRGHRFVTVRRLDEAIADLGRAAKVIRGRPDEVEPDGLPNARNIPTSTLHTNIWYHLALAHYVKGDFAAARAAHEGGMATATNPDMLTAMSYWLYLTQRRLGDSAAAARTLEAVHPDFDIIENHGYHRLMMLYQGRVPLDSVQPPGGPTSLDDVTTAYGVGAWHLIEGRPQQAEAVFRRIVAARSQWPAFGYLAAEGELARGVAR